MKKTDTKDIKFLWKQVEHLTTKLRDERAERLKLTNLLQKARDTHQEELEAELKSHTDTMSEDQELTYKLRAEQGALCEVMEQQIKDLKIRLDGQTSINLEHATKGKPGPPGHCRFTGRQAAGGGGNL